MLLPVMLRDKGLSPQVIGLMYTILPFVTLVTISLSGAIADSFKIHKIMFVVTLIFITIGSSATYFLPSVTNKSLDLGLNSFERNTSHSKVVNNETEFHELTEIVKQSTFWITFLFMLMYYIGLNASIVFTDAACFKILGKISGIVKS